MKHLHSYIQYQSSRIRRRRSSGCHAKYHNQIRRDNEHSVNSSVRMNEPFWSEAIDCKDVSCNADNETWV